MNFPPGTSQQYSHTDNVILGQVIQRATGQSMKELYDKNIFWPMSMNDTQFPVDQEIQSPVLHAFTLDRKFYEDCTYWNPFFRRRCQPPTLTIGQMGPIRDRPLDLAGHFSSKSPRLCRQGPERARPLFCLWIRRLQRLDHPKP